MSSALDELRAGLKDKVDAAVAAGDATKLKDLEDALRAAAETEKLDLEAENSRRLRRSESVRFWVPVILSAVSSVALVVTLWIQIISLRQSRDLQIQTNEGTEFRDVIKTAALPPEMKAVSSITRLKGFLSPTSAYNQEARDVALTWLGAMPDKISFELLFGGVERTTTRENFSGLVQLSDELNTSLQFTNERIEQLKKRAEQARDGAAKRLRQRGRVRLSGPPLPVAFPPAVPFGYQRSDAGMPAEVMMDPDELQKVADSVTDEIGTVSRAIADFLRNQQPAYADADLSKGMIWQADLSGIDLSKANLDGAGVQSSNVTDADFGSVSEFYGSTWDFTQWWRARRLSMPLLKYLKENYPYDAKVNYAGEPASKAQYDKEVARLEAQAG